MNGIPTVANGTRLPVQFHTKRTMWCRALALTVKMLLVTAGVIVAGAVGFCWWAGREVASPPRRPLQDYHREFLVDPSARGVVVTPFTLDDGTPCLMCVPHLGGRLGERGLKVRAQLAERGFSLPDPPKITGTLVLMHGRRGRKEDFLTMTTC